MKRRDFLQFSGLSLLVTGAFKTSAVSAKTDISAPVSDIFYTKDSPGRWKEKVAGHLPSIGIEKSAGKITVKVVTAHEMKGYEHYIVKHVLLDKDYKFIDEHMFNPEKEKAAVSTFVLEGYSGAIHALSMCNKHDVWLNSSQI